MNTEHLKAGIFNQSKILVWCHFNLRSLNLLLFWRWFSLPSPSIESFSNDDGDGNENFIKAIGLICKTITLHVQHTFLYIFLPSLQDYGVKIPNLPFMEDVINKQQRIFLSLSKLECGPQEINSREIWHFQQFGISATKLKKREFILKVTFLLPSPSSMLKLDGSRGDMRNKVTIDNRWTLIHNSIY